MSVFQRVRSISGWLCSHVWGEAIAGTTVRGSDADGQRLQACKQRYMKTGLGLHVSLQMLRVLSIAVGRGEGS